MMYTNHFLLVFFVTLVLLNVENASGKILSVCEAVRALERAQIQRSYFGNWLCLMKSESGMDTRLVKGPLSASSYSYGIFQISSKHACIRGRKGGLCDAKCEDFVSSDDITEDTKCAKKIQAQEGFQAWPGWVIHCKNKILPAIPACRKKRGI